MILIVLLQSNLKNKIMSERTNSILPNFFESNDYFIDEKINYFKFGNTYKVYDKEGEQVGIINQKVTGWHKFLRLFLNKAMFPFLLEVRDMDDELQVSIKRGWTFWMSKISIIDANDNLVGTIKQKFKFLKPTFIIESENGDLIAKITGDWKAWDFKIEDADQNSIGTINKKWGGIMKEAFTRADKYYVAIVPEYAEDRNKMAIVSAAITVDMVMKNGK
jgi:uncharacterized protein YxjI